jgi:phage shock protein PspC (stress-responsive transcriptional regulator)
MRKVTTINLNNNAYQIDEDGYEALRAYLDKSERALANNPDRAEILADLEQAIADKCRLALGPYKTVVNAAEIERILKEMGPVEGAGNADPAAGADGISPDAGTQSTVGAPHRMYRINEGAIWSGVCTGLAAYAGLDVAFVRLAFILFTIASVGTGFLVYLLMIVLVPKAVTPAEKSAAYGQPFNAQELVDRVKKKHDDFREERRERRRMNRMSRAAGLWSPQTVPQPPPGYAARVTGGVLLPLLTVLSAAWFAAMAVAAFVVWQSWPYVGLDAWPPGSWAHGHADFPRWVALVIIFVVYALFAMPIGAARRASLYYANGGRLHGWADAWSGLLWLALVAVLALAAWYLVPQLQELLPYRLQLPNAISL